MKRLLHVYVWLLVIAASILPLQAQATPSLVVDAATGEVLHSEDAGLPWYPASITKLMTAFVVFERMEAGLVALDTEVVLSPAAIRQIPVKSELPAGSAMSLEDALYAILVASTNDVAVAIAEAVGGSVPGFAAMMNDAATRLGMSGSRFANPNGVHDPEQHTTARDLALLTIELTRRFPQHMRFFGVGRVEIAGRELLSYNDLLTRYPGTLGMKTGYVCASGRNIVGLVNRGGRTLIAIVLGATTERERGERAAQLLTRAFDGALQSSGIGIARIENRTDQRPRDMRRLLCSDAAAGYEREQNALYPMGLPGQPSFLGEPMALESRTLTVWRSAYLPAQAPKPTPRPAYP